MQGDRWRGKPNRGKLVPYSRELAGYQGSQSQAIPGQIVKRVARPMHWRPFSAIAQVEPGAAIDNRAPERIDVPDQGGQRPLGRRMRRRRITRPQEGQ
jgi:hypothetical protein